MDKIAAYEMLLDQHPLWTKEAFLFGRKAPGRIFPRQFSGGGGRAVGDTRTFLQLGKGLPADQAGALARRAKAQARETGENVYDIYERLRGGA